MSEMTPERLDAILDGRDAPTDDEARDMLALAGALREAVPGAGEGLRARVRALPQPQPAGRPRWLRASGWRGRALIAAPAVFAAIAAVIAIGVIARSPDGRSGGADSSQADRLSQATIEAAPPSSTAQPAATDKPAQTGSLPDPVVVQIAPATITARIADVRRLVAAAGGRVVEEVQQQTTPSVLASITLPGERRAEVLQAVVALGTGTRAAARDFSDESGFGAAAVPGVPTSVRVLLTEGP